MAAAPERGRCCTQQAVREVSPTSVRIYVLRSTSCSRQDCRGVCQCSFEITIAFEFACSFLFNYSKRATNANHSDVCNVMVSIQLKKFFLLLPLHRYLPLCIYVVIDDGCPPSAELVRIAGKRCGLMIENDRYLIATWESHHMLDGCFSPFTGSLFVAATVMGCSIL